MGNLNIDDAVLREMEKNLVPFRYVVLSNDPDKELPAADFHYRLSDMLLNGKNNVAMEMFRESGKSSYALRTFPLHCLAYPKKGLDFIVIIKQNQRMASAKLKDIIEKDVRHALIDKGLSISDVASELGVSASYIYDIMNGNRVATEMKQKLIDFLGLGGSYE